MPDLHLLHADYELRELRNGIAVLRNTETGQEIEQPVHVNLNDGVVRIELCAKPVADLAAVH
jgi:hypothetical protein